MYSYISYSNNTSSLAQVSPDELETQIMDLVGDIEAMNVEPAASEQVESRKDGKRRQAEKDSIWAGWLGFNSSLGLFKTTTFCSYIHMYVDRISYTQKICTYIYYIYIICF